MKPDYKMFNRMMPAMVLISGIIYIPLLRRKLIAALEDGYSWIDSPESDLAARILEIFDSFRLFSIAFALLIVIAVALLRSKMPEKFVTLFALGIAAFAVGCGVFALRNGVVPPLTPYIFEQGLCSAALSAVIFLFPEKKKY